MSAEVQTPGAAGIMVPGVIREKQGSGVMRGEDLQRRPDYKVVCTWCGGVIRHSSVKDSRGMCLTCYAHLLNEHFRARRTATPSRASER
jgi:hypothetical protein